MSRKSLDSILTDVDEPEESPDNEQPAEIEAEAPVDELEDSPDNDEPEEQPEAKAKAEPKEKSESEGEGKKDGLPPWMHARVKSASEAKEAAERRAAELETRLRQLEQQPQQDPQSIQEVIQSTVGQALTTYEQRQNQQDWERRVNESHVTAAEKFGEEVTQSAAQWAADRMSYDPAFAQQLRGHPQPTVFSVQEFNKAQAYQELDKYGGDLEKFIEAKLAERGQVQTDEPASPQVQSQKQGKMPGNFSGTPSARTGRSGPSFTGPTPLGDLLNNS
jgi:hypothetical protein